jgi:putative membrane protein
LTVRESPLHRYFRRVAVKVDTAGGGENEAQARNDREYFAPILPRDSLNALVRSVVGVDLRSVVWFAPHPRAFRREVKGWLVIGLLVLVALASVARWYALLFAPLILAWAVVAARRTIGHLRWAATDDAVLFTSGWLWRRIVVARFAKIQVVTRRESPFDRRTAMAAVHVDTAGASDGSAIRIPYLARDTADHLYRRLASVASETQFRW